MTITEVFSRRGLLRPGYLLVVGASLALIVLSFPLWKWEEGAGAAEIAAFLAYHAPQGAHDFLWILLSQAGNGFALLFLLGCAFLAGRRPEVIVLAVLSMAMAGALALVLKLAFNRIRPSGHSAFSWPSGHSAAISTIAVVLVVKSWPKGLLAVLLALGVMLARIVVGRHFPSDVLAGMAIGVVTGATVTAFPWPAWTPRSNSTAKPVVLGLLLAAWWWPETTHGNLALFMNLVGSPVLLFSALVCVTRPQGRPAPA